MKNISITLNIILLLTCGLFYWKAYDAQRFSDFWFNSYQNARDLNDELSEKIKIQDHPTL